MKSVASVYVTVQHVFIDKIRKGFVHNYLGERRYRIIWDNDISPCILNFYSFNILEIKLTYHNGEERCWQFVNEEEFEEAFKVLRRCCIKLEKQTQPHQPKQIQPPLRLISPPRPADAADEINTKFGDAFNAVLITPDSWFDKKLQEMYYSKRRTSEELKENEQDTH